MNPPATAGVRFERFVASDAGALAALLRDPEITRNITANTSSDERALACAQHRIGWHNTAWDAQGYGVWALRSDDPAIAPAGELIGWCGFAEPDDPPGDPEILYGLARKCWGKGLGTRVARVAIDRLFETTDHAGVSAIISARLNPGTLAVVSKLGMQRIGTMAFTAFLPDEAFAADVLAYELWRLRESAAEDIDLLVERTCYRAGQLATACADQAPDLERRLLDAARARFDTAADAGSLSTRVNDLTRSGRCSPAMDWFHVSASNWLPAAG